jgi:hypothetical protein
MAEIAQDVWSFEGRATPALTTNAPWGNPITANRHLFAGPPYRQIWAGE